MHSRATDRRSASKCQGKWPDQTLEQAFGFTRVLVAVSTSRLSCKRVGKNANIDAGLGFIWRISVYVYSRGGSSRGPAYGNTASQILEFDRNGVFLREIGKDLY